MIRFTKSIVLFLMLVILYSCEKSKESKNLADRLFPVEVQEVTERDIPVYIEAIGNVVAFNRIDVRPQVNGKVIDVYVQGGQDVQAGDILYQIDPIPYQIALHRARATLSKDQAQLDYARQKLERYEKLGQSNFVSKLSIEEYRSNVRTQEGQVMIDQAEVNLAEVNLNYCRVLAPVNGRISLNLIDVGNLVTANDPNALTRILQISPIYVSFAIPQGQFQDLQHVLAEGKRQFKAILPFGDEQKFDGELVAIDNQVNSQTGTIQLRGIIPNQGKILWPGEFVRVQLFIRTKYHVPTVPAEAIQVGQKGSFVYVLKPDETVELVYVKTGERIDHDHLAINEGLTPGTKIVTNGQLNLRPGAKVALVDKKDQFIAEQEK